MRFLKSSIEKKFESDLDALKRMIESGLLHLPTYSSAASELLDKIIGVSDSFPGFRGDAVDFLLNARGLIISSKLMHFSGVHDLYERIDNYLNDTQK